MANRRELDLPCARPSFRRMTATSFLDLKQRLVRLSEAERRELSAFLVRRGQERPVWKKETARRLKEMADGKQVSVAVLRRRFRHTGEEVAHINAAPPE